MKTTMINKSIALLTAVLALCLCLVGCDLRGLFGEMFGGLSPVEQHPVTQMYVTLDYGNFRPDTATPLINHCTTEFLDKERWDLDVFLPGDVYVITHSGELVIMESYPGQIALQRGELISVNRIDAGIVKLESTNMTSLNAGVKVTGDLPEYVVLDEQGSFCPLSEYQSESGVLYATYQRDAAIRDADGVLCVDALALYAFAPRTTHTATFTARYDYGFHRLGKAEILMNDSTVFIDYALIAGDMVQIGYSGSMLIQETYPSTVVFADGGRVERVDVLQARLCVLKVIKSAEGEKMLVLPDGTPIESLPNYVLTDPSGSYSSWKLYNEGTELYGSYTAEQGNTPTEIAGLYTYLPRE